MVSYDEDDRKAGWWNDIHCTNDKSRAFVCAYDNGVDHPDLSSVILLAVCFSTVPRELVPVQWSLLSLQP